MKKELTVLNDLGLHIRPASLLVACVSAHKSEVNVEKSGELVNCRSILNLMMLSATKGTTLVFNAVGEDAEEVLDKITLLFESKFDEE